MPFHNGVDVGPDLMGPAHSGRWRLRLQDLWILVTILNEASKGHLKSGIPRSANQMTILRWPLTAAYRLDHGVEYNLLCKGDKGGMAHHPT